MKPRTAANAAIAMIVAGYPFVVYFGLGASSTRTLAAVLAAVGLLRMATALLPGRRQVLPILLGLVLTLLAAATWMRGDAGLFRYYPVLCNALLFAVFATTLVRPPSMIERFARALNPDLPARAVAYTRTVTLVWCGVFVLNGTVALWTALAASWQVWSLYNGFVAYLVIGAVFAAEFAIRRRLRADTP